MKITVFTDLHCSFAALEKLKDKAQDSEILLCAGDISVFEDGLEEMLEAINGINKPCYIIPGNHEDEVALDIHSKKFEHIINVHLKSHPHEQLLILGHGGGGFSHRSVEFVEVEHDFKSAIEQHKSKFSEGKVILILHQPPHGTELDQHWESYTGNKDYTDFIKKYQPDLVICGHIHENQNKQDKIGNTLVINPGPEGQNIDL